MGKARELSDPIRPKLARPPPDGSAFARGWGRCQGGKHGLDIRPSELVSDTRAPAPLVTMSQCVEITGSPVLSECTLNPRPPEDGWYLAIVGGGMPLNDRRARRCTRPSLARIEMARAATTLAAAETSLSAPRPRPRSDLLPFGEDRLRPMCQQLAPKGVHLLATQLDGQRRWKEFQTLRLAVNLQRRAAVDRMPPQRKLYNVGDSLERRQCVRSGLDSCRNTKNFVRGAHRTAFGSAAEAWNTLDCEG